MRDTWTAYTREEYVLREGIRRIKDHLMK